MRFSRCVVVPVLLLSYLSFSSSYHGYQNSAIAQRAPIRIDSGSGNFDVKGGPGREEKAITVYSHRPKSFTRRSPVLFVIPGAGRNGSDYRDSWIAASEKYGVLILSPQYLEKDYPEFWSYNLAGMLTDVEVNRVEGRVVRFNVSKNPKDWIFGDFDRIFNEVRSQLDLERTTYDMFGHSAGGQVLHRLALFHPQSKASRIVVANSGWYTVPTFDDTFPYGLGNSTATEDQVTKAFQTDLVVFLGELDNETETRGDLVRTPEVDIQGISRVERCRYFFKKATETARTLKAPFNWKLHVVPKVGHDMQRMGEAAAEYLYSDSRSR